MLEMWPTWTSSEELPKYMDETMVNLLLSLKLATSDISPEISILVGLSVVKILCSMLYPNYKS